jgi:nucleotide-binding universal stress UspA family protein
MKAQPVVVGVDGSLESVRAAAIASRIAGGSSAECILVYAVPMMWMPGGTAEPITSPEVADRVVAHACTSLAHVGVDAPVTARPGKAGVVLQQVARERDAGLIVVGGRHHGPLERGLGGSTAHHLVRTADAPVLIVEPGTETIERVLVAVDLFNGAGPTLRAADRLAGALGAQLRAVHVIEPAKYPVVVPLSLDQAEYERRCRDEFVRLIESQLPDLPLDERVVRTGVADEEIAEEATVWHADLVVVGSHGKKWIDRLLIGSTTERLLNRLPASLLVVPVRPSHPATGRQDARSADAAHHALV